MSEIRNRFGSNTASCRVLVVGASGELGGALARIYASHGADLVLWGRDPKRLESIASACGKAGAAATNTRSFDLEDLDGALAELAACDEAAPIDIALFASGLGDIREAGALVEDSALVVRLTRVNYLAPVALSAELAGRMAERGRGNIVLVGSAASFHALPFASAYAASKAGLARFADALRIAVRPHGVIVTLVSPGFIDTAAARRVPGPKPLAMSPGHAAAAIVKAAAKGKAHLIMPWPFALLRLIDRAVPRPLRDRLLRALTPTAG